MQMKYMMTYYDSISAIKLLSESERGRLFLALLEYGNRDNINDYQMPNFPGKESLLFEMLKSQMDRDENNYDKKCETSRENGRLGGAPKGNKNAKKQPNQPKNNLNNPKKEKEKDKEKDEEKYLPPLSPNGDISPKGNGEVEIAASAAPRGVSAEIKEKFFDDFWAKYPKKVAKEAARKAYLRLKSTTPNKVMAGLLKWKKAEQWTKDGGKFVPNPATFLNQRL